MLGKKKDFFVYFYEIPNVKKRWRSFLAIGILLIVLGVLSIGFAQWATEFTVILLGLFLLGGGVLQIINGFYASKWTGFSLSLLLGVFYMIAGLLCIAKPIQSATGISLLIAAMLLVGGCFRMITSYRYRFENWGWVFINGIVALLLGLLILAEWPASALWVIGLFVGVDMLLVGSYWVRMSLLAKK